jgi:hypothetical protein
MRSLTALLCAVLLLLNAGCGQEATGAATKEELVANYLKALESRGTGGLSHATVRADRFAERLDLDIRGKRCYLLLPSDSPAKASEDPLATITSSAVEP